MRRFLLLAAAHAAAEAASASQCFSYSEITVTDCGATKTTPAVTAASATDKLTPGVITVTMPECDKCNHCDSCAYTHLYTTAYEYICPTGIATTTYTVCEKYPGMTAKPSMATPTGCPYGFTTTVEKCTVCGPQTVTKTLTVPIEPVPTKDKHGGGGGGTGVPHVTGAAAGSASVSLVGMLVAMVPVLFMI